MTEEADVTYFLSKGSHATAADGRCANEWIAYLAGERHSDDPVCVSPVLRSYAMSLNDTWDDEQRQKLRPYLARCIGTAGDGRDEERGWLAMDWLIRVFTPRFLDLRPELVEHAARLRGLSPVLAPLALDDAMITLRAARDAAWAAARAAAGDAAWAAARDAAWAALQPVVIELQASALDLFDRMLPTEIVQIPAVGLDEAALVCGITVFV